MCALDIAVKQQRKLKKFFGSIESRKTSTAYVHLSWLFFFFFQVLSEWKKKKKKKWNIFGNNCVWWLCVCAIISMIENMCKYILMQCGWRWCKYKRRKKYKKEKKKTRQEYKLKWNEYYSRRQTSTPFAWTCQDL